MAPAADAGDLTGFINGIEDEARREDSRALLGLMREVTGEEPKLGGSSMVGLGTYYYRLDDLDHDVLTTLIERSVAHIDQTEADTGGVPRMSEMPPPEV